MSSFRIYYALVHEPTGEILTAAGKPLLFPKRSDSVRFSTTRKFKEALQGTGVAQVDVTTRPVVIQKYGWR